MLPWNAMRLGCGVNGVLVQIDQDIVILRKLNIFVTPFDTDNIWTWRIQC
jgi:hypothetical protein